MISSFLSNFANEKEIKNEMATDKVTYWIEIANEDLEVAEDLYKAKRWLFMLRAIG